MSFFKNTRNLVTVAILGAIGAILMILNINIPSIMPVFIKLDFADLPAIIASFAFGPTGGLMVCLIKNLLNLILASNTGGVGELSNFILGCAYVIPAGFIYKKHHNFKGAIIGTLVGSVTSAFIGYFSNYYVIYPLFTLTGLSMSSIIGMYTLVFPNIDTLWEALLYFNVPFTFIKFLLTSILTFLIYKRISPILKGKKKRNCEAREA
jgi:riboflavin transporter FmnP